VGECFFWYRPTRVVPDKGQVNGGVCVCVCVRACVCVCVCVCKLHCIDTKITKQVFTVIFLFKFGNYYD